MTESEQQSMKGLRERIKQMNPDELTYITTNMKAALADFAERYKARYDFPMIITVTPDKVQQSNFQDIYNEYNRNKTDTMGLETPQPDRIRNEKDKRTNRRNKLFQRNYESGGRRTKGTAG